MGSSCWKNIVGSLFCIALLSAAGIAAYRYGPWFKDDSEDPGESLVAKTSGCTNCCNGLESNYCELPIDQVLWPVVHNAMSSLDHSFIGANNNLSLEKALVEGYRGLMLDSCLCDGDNIIDVVQDYVGIGGNDNGEADAGKRTFLGFCHTKCGAGVRKPERVLSNIKTFLDLNPNEVLILEFEVGEGTSELLYRAIDDSGLDKYIYIDEGNDGIVDKWPTFQQLINANRRLLIFAHGDGIESCRSGGQCHEGIMYKFDHISQTKWNDNTCDLNGNDQTIPEDRGFFLMNHWLNNEYDLPSKSNAEEFNTYEALSNRFSKCGARSPNMIAVDFWSTGEVLNFVQDQNVRKGGEGTTIAANSRSGSIRHKWLTI